MNAQAVGLKIKLDVEPQVGQLLDSQSRICNWLYNHLLETANALKARFIARDGQDEEAAKTVYSKRGLRDLVPGLKQEHPFLKTVHSSPLKNTALRLSSSIRERQKSRRGQRKGDEVNWPKFRSWKRKWFSLEYEEPWKGYKLKGRVITLSLGANQEGRRLRVKVRLRSPLFAPRSSVKALRIVKELGEFYAVFTVERALSETSTGEPARIIALDPNHKNLAYGVGTDGQAIEIENLATLKRLDRRIDELKSRRDRCRRRSRLVQYTREDGSIHRHWEASRRWKRYDQALQRAYRKRREQSKTFLYTVANALCREYEVIGVGDYTPRGGGISRGMRRAMNNQSLIGRFKRVTKWVALKSGRLYTEFDEHGTTRTCCACDTVVKDGIPLQVRAWTCHNPECGSSHIRDENAAQNGLRKVKKQLVPGSGRVSPVEVLARCTWRVAPTGVLTLPGGVTALERGATKID